MAKWTWEITDAAFNPIGEILNAKERKLTLPLNKVNTASFKIRLDNPLAESLSTDLGYIKIHRNGLLLFYGPLISVQEVGEGDNSSMHITASGPEWIFSQRLAGKTFEGIKYTLEQKVTRAEGIRFLLRATNESSETHIDFETGPVSTTGFVAYESPPFKLISEVFNDLGNTAEGFDWAVHPLENISGNGVFSQKIGRLEIVDVIGTKQDNAVFEWGTGRNNISYFSRTLDRSTLLNRAYHIGPGGPDATGSPTETAQDASSIATYGLQEGVISASILNNELREKLVKENVEVRKNPRQTIIFQPSLDDETGRVPVLGKDFNVGDIVRARIVLDKVEHLPISEVRVWGAEFTLDDNEKETQTLTLSNQ
jgi:hypothetical protein